MTGCAAVYVAAACESGPSRIGHCLNVEKKRAEGQAWYPNTIRFDVAIWVPSVSTARAVEDLAHGRLMGNGAHLRGDWFAVSPDFAAEELARSASALGIPYYRNGDAVPAWLEWTGAE